MHSAFIYGMTRPSAISFTYLSYMNRIGICGHIIHQLIRECSLLQRLCMWRIYHACYRKRIQCCEPISFRGHRNGATSQSALNNWPIETRNECSAANGNYSLQGLFSRSLALHYACAKRERLHSRKINGCSVSNH